jgi:hypothetical protein
MKQELSNVRDRMIDMVFQPELGGDWVETGATSGGNNGEASLIAAIVQRAAQRSPDCELSGIGLYGLYIPWMGPKMSWTTIWPTTTTIL